jgi:hypothetical protein
MRSPLIIAAVTAIDSFERFWSPKWTPCRPDATDYDISAGRRPMNGPWWPTNGKRRARRIAVIDVLITATTLHVTQLRALIEQLKPLMVDVFLFSIAARHLWESWSRRD